MSFQATLAVLFGVILITAILQAMRFNKRDTQKGSGEIADSYPAPDDFMAERVHHIALDSPRVSTASESSLVDCGDGSGGACGGDGGGFDGAGN